MKKLVILSGAGISAESGLQTFRGQGGLWEGYDIMEVASPQAWMNNPELVLDFYNQRRAQLNTVEPNEAHYGITELESTFQVQVVTQNVDDLHERAGNSQILHLHGELRKVRSTFNEDLVYKWTGDLSWGDVGDDGYQLRPHIVWFGEMVPMLPKAQELISDSNIVVIIGTSLQVYPAAGLISSAPVDAEVFYIDPHPYLNHELKIRPHTVIQKPATEGIKDLLELLLG